MSLNDPWVVWPALIGLAAIIYVYRPKKVTYVQFAGGALYAVVSKAVNPFKRRYFLEVSQGFESFRSFRKKTSFAHIEDAVASLTTTPHEKKWSHVFTSLGLYRLGFLKDGTVSTWRAGYKGKTIYAYNVELDAIVGSGVEKFFKMWLGSKAVKNGKLAKSKAVPLPA